MTDLCQACGGRGSHEVTDPYFDGNWVTVHCSSCFGTGYRRTSAPRREDPQAYERAIQAAIKAIDDHVKGKKITR